MKYLQKRVKIADKQIISDSYSGIERTDGWGDTDISFIAQHFSQEISSQKQEILSQRQLLEKLVKDVGFLKTTRPRIEESYNIKEVLFKELQKNIENLLTNFKDKVLRLNNLIDLKNVLANLNKEARKWNNVYLLRAIIVFYDSIKHAYAEKLSKKQCDVIKQVGNIITDEVVDRNKFREVYRKLLAGKFQVIPEPKINE